MNQRRLKVMFLSIPQFCKFGREEAAVILKQTFPTRGKNVHLCGLFLIILQGMSREVYFLQKFIPSSLTVIIKSSSNCPLRTLTFYFELNSMTPLCE